MNSESPTNSSDKSFIPIVLLGISLVVFFGWQLSEISKNKENIAKANTQWDEIAVNNGPKAQAAENQSKAVEEVLNKLAGDVYKLSQDGDALAEKIVKAHGMKYQGPPPAPSPAATGTQP